LSLIKGISEKTAQKLFQEFKSIEAIKTGTLEALEKSIGKAKAKLVFEFFNHTT